MWKEKWEKLLDLAFPPGLYCNICGNLIDGARAYHLCDHCLSHIRWDTEGAIRAAELSMLRVCEYGVYERSLIFSLKYQNRKYLARDLGQMMKDKWEVTPYYQTWLHFNRKEEFPVLLPIPLSQEKLKLRGYNQTELIGKYFSKETGFPLVSDGLLRTKNTRPMRGLSPREREDNIRGAFEVNPREEKKLINRRIILLDDFATTGATGREALRAIESVSPKEVVFFAFAAKYGDAIGNTGEEHEGEALQEL